MSAISETQVSNITMAVVQSQARARWRREAPPSLIEPHPTVVVKVTNQANEQGFTVHKNYIEFYSRFFRTAFNGPFKEGETGVMTLSDTTPAAFGIFVNWLYTQTIVNKDGKTPHCSTLIDLWILADKTIAPSLQNQTIEVLNSSRLETNTFSASLTRKIYDNTMYGSPLRAYAVDIIVQGPPFDLNDEIEYPNAYLLDVINGIKTQVRKGHNPKRFFSPWEPTADEMKKYFVKEHEDSLIPPP